MQKQELNILHMFKELVARGYIKERESTGDLQFPGSYPYEPIVITYNTADINLQAKEVKNGQLG